jgi:hypothetical protein
VTAMTKPTSPDPIEQIERVQKILGVAATLDDLEGGKREVLRLIADGADELEEIGSRRKIEMTAATPAGELDKRLDAIDKREKEVARRVEIAKTVCAELENRIDAAREADAADKRQAAYDEAIKLRDATALRVQKFLDRIGAEAREVMRAYAASESKSAAANQGLPPGAAPIHSIESKRKGELRSPKLTVREFEAFVDGRRFIAERGHAQAAERKDGKWDVFLPGGGTGAGDYFVCAISNFVEVTSEADATPWPENLAKCLSVPSFYVSDRSGWDPVDDPSPAAVTDALNRLEAQPPHHFEPRVSTRTMSLAAWREMNGEGVEVEPSPVAVAAE